MTQSKQAARTAVFLSERYVDIFGFEKVSNLGRYRLVAIVGETSRRNFPADKEHLFSAIYTVADKGGARTALPELAYAPTREIIERKLSQVESRLILQHAHPATRPSGERRILLRRGAGPRRIH